MDEQQNGHIRIMWPQNDKEMPPEWAQGVLNRLFALHPAIYGKLLRMEVLGEPVKAKK